MNLDRILENMDSLQASDLHLKVGERPGYRVHGTLSPQEGDDFVTCEDLHEIAQRLLNEDQRNRLEGDRQIDFAYGTSRGKRFRCNFFYDYRGPAAAFRCIPQSIPTPEALQLPEVVESLAHLHSGLVIISGSTGTGKTSTISSLINTINVNFGKHIITLEDPVEYRHTNKKSLITQMGLHSEFNSFDLGIRSALRQDPDVIVVSELRSLETIRLSLLAAELGALVFTTLHTNGAPESISRILDVFDAGEQGQMRAVLADCLAAVVSQVLLKRKDGDGRIVATEVLVNTAAVQNLIRHNRIQDIQSIIQSGGTLGMRTLEESLQELVSTGLVAAEEALPYSSEKKRLLAAQGALGSFAS